MKNSKGFALTNIVFFIIAFLVVGGVAYYAGTKNNSQQKTNLTNKTSPTQASLSNSFVIKLHGDLSSPGAGRNYEANLIFVENTLMSGKATYYSGDIFRKENNFECVYNNKQWIDAKASGMCQLPQNLYDYLPTTKDELINKINLGLIKPVGNACGQGYICYELIK